MAARRMHTYAKAYSFGTDGSAALAGAPIASRRPLGSIAQRAPIRGRGLRVPVWAVLVGLAGVVFILSFLLLGVRSQATLAAKQAGALRAELSAQMEIIGGLEVKIAEASDPQRIHSIAVNRLNMRQPTEEQIRVVPRPNLREQTVLRAEAEPEKFGLLKALLSLVGL